MNNELLPLIRELCFIAVTRNEINARRHRARYRKNYYANAVRVVEAFNVSNYELRDINRRLKFYSSVDLSTLRSDHIVFKWSKRKKVIEKNMKMITNNYINHKKPIKWVTIGLHKLRSLMLKAEGEYAMAKHETMELSLSTTERVKEILKLIKGSITYDNGSISHIIVAGEPLIGPQIADYATEYKLDLAVEGMLRS